MYQIQSKYNFGMSKQALYFLMANAIQNIIFSEFSFLGDVVWSQTEKSKANLVITGSTKTSEYESPFEIKNITSFKTTFTDCVYISNSTQNLEFYFPFDSPQQIMRFVIIPFITKSSGILAYGFFCNGKSEYTEELNILIQNFSILIETHVKNQLVVMTHNHFKFSQWMEKDSQEKERVEKKCGHIKRPNSP